MSAETGMTAAAPVARGGAAVRAAVVPAAVSARGWGWRHAGRAAPAVRGLDLEIAPGERVLLVGPSGAGKSTLLHALAGVLHRDEESEDFGDLLIDGRPAEASRGRAGLVQQDPETQVVLARVGDDVAFGAENLAVPREEIWDRVAAALDAVGLDVPLDHPTAHLSGGQKQRLALAGILAMRPGLVLLDEPTANLDPNGVLEVRDAVIAAVAATGATLVVVEHRLAAWAGHMDRVVVLEPGGGVSHSGTPEELFAEGPVRADLIDAGVWVPGHVPVLEPMGGPTGERSGNRPGPALLSAAGLAVSREASRRPSPRGPRPVLSGVDLELRAGEAVGIAGPNGAGKSTLALTLAGLLEPLEGQVRAAPDLAGGLSPEPFRWKAGDLVSRIGTVFQEPEHQFLASTVREDLAFGPRHARNPRTGRPLFTPEEVERRVDELLDRLRLGHLADANPFTLSGGEKRRLSVATVLAAGPGVLVLDEPTFGQDANTWRELALLLREELAAGHTVLAVTHDEHFTAALGARTVSVGTGGIGTGRTGAGAAGPGIAMAAARSVLARSLLGRANPLAKLVAVLLATAGLVATLDWVSASVVVCACLALLPLSGVAPFVFLRRAWPLAVAGLMAAWGTALVGNDAGAVLLDLGIFTLTEGSVAAGAATGLRGFAVALPAVLVMASTDPTDLADALAQKARLPHRFVLGGLAALRLLGLLAEEWRTLGMARRARGVGSRGSAGARLRANLGQAFGLLVQAIRRASRLAVTMEAKGFGEGPRTWARVSVFTGRDAWVLLGGAAVGAAATGAALATGAWNLVWS